MGIRLKENDFFPFERNKYFYGKLLTEQNFIQEQKYFNNKRRMLNRFLHGEGVAAGLNVVAIDERNISVEAGIALDFAGREIVMETPVNKKLSIIDEFENATGENEQECVYLCIEYDEKETEPTHNIANSGVFKADHVDYDKTKEGYHLYITETEPQYAKLTPTSLYEQTVLLYWKNGIRISQIVPRFIKSGEEFVTKFVIENRGNAKQISLSITENLECAIYETSRSFVLREELLIERFSNVTKSFSCQAMEVEQGEVRFHIEEEQFQIAVDRREAERGKGQIIEVPITKLKFYEGLLTHSIRTYMEEVVWNSEPRGIYLARIYLIKTGKAYMIDRIENMPFGQYVYNSQVTMSMIQHMKEELLELKEKGGQRGKVIERKGDGQFLDRANGLFMSQGNVEIDLGIGGKRGQRYKTLEIYHGLGLGPVKISLEIQQGDLLFSGNSEVFEDMPIQAEMAVKLDKSKGSFVVGIRLLQASAERNVTIHWTAVTDTEFVEKADAKQKLYIKPNLLELKVRESCQLEAVYKMDYQSEIIWKVQSVDGGTISRDGLYTAPNRPGVYEVTAQTGEDEKLRTSLFVVVRE